MLDVFKKLKAPPGEEKVLQYATRMAEQMIAQNKVITVRTGHELEDAMAHFMRADPTMSEMWARE